MQCGTWRWVLCAKVVVATSSEGFLDNIIFVLLINVGINRNKYSYNEASLYCSQAPFEQPLLKYFMRKIISNKRCLRLARNSSVKTWPKKQSVNVCDELRRLCEHAPQKTHWALRKAMIDLIIAWRSLYCDDRQQLQTATAPWSPIDTEAHVWRRITSNANVLL